MKEKGFIRIPLSCSIFWELYDEIRIHACLIGLGVDKKKKRNNKYLL